MDSTAEVAPFRLLVAPLRDQEALVVPAAAAAALKKTPALPPYPFLTSFKADGTLADTGALKAHMVATYRDDQELIVRALARNIAPAEWDKASQYISSMTGFGGTTSSTRFPGAADYTAPATVIYDYTRKSYGDWDNLKIVPLAPALTLVNYAGETKAPQHDIELGVPRTETVESRIKLPDGWHADLPSAVHARSTYATLDRTYHFVDGTVVTDRTLTVLQPKVPVAEWRQYQAFCKDAGMDSESWTQLIRPGVKTTAKAIPDTLAKDTAGNSTPTITLGPAAPAVAGAPDDASVDTLRQTASRQLQAGDFAGTRKTLNRIKAKAPDAPYLNLMYGSLALVNRNFDEAITDFRKETDLQPDAGAAWGALSAAQYQKGDKAEARQTLQGYVMRHPENVAAGGQLAAWQSEAEDFSAAIQTLQAMSKTVPDDRRVRLQLSNALLAAHRNDEAAAAAKGVLDGTDDPGLMNDAGYVLAELGQDLSQAEQASRASIAKLEVQSRTIAPDEVNSTAFQQSNLLIALWDTLGWVLFREGKLDDARPYLLAAWRNDLHAEVGDHVGQLDEAAGNAAGALEHYRLARASIEGQVKPAVRTHLDSSIERLGKASSTAPETALLNSQIATLEAKKDLSPEQKKFFTDRMRARSAAGGATQQLVQLRTYTVPRRKDSSGWGTFRLQLTATGVQAVQQSSGEPKLAAEMDDLKSMRFPELVPPASSAWLLRSGVLSCPSTGSTCELVLVPNASLATEQQQ